MKVAAVVTTFNRPDLLGECLNSLLQQSRPLDEILVIDDCSSQETELAVRSFSPSNVHYIRFAKNMGSAYAFYYGIKVAYERSADWVWIIDDDSVLSKEALTELLSFVELQDQELISAVATRVVDILGFDQVHHRGEFSFKKLEINPIIITDALPFRIRMSSWTGLLINRGAITRVGLPDEKYFIDVADIDYTLRLNKVGAIYCVPNSILVHNDGITGQLSSVQRRRRRTRAWREYYGLRNIVYLGLKLGRSSTWVYFRGGYLLGRKILGIIVYDTCKAKRMKFLLHGFLDGVSGRMIRRYGPND